MSAPAHNRFHRVRFPTRNRKLLQRANKAAESSLSKEFAASVSTLSESKHRKAMDEEFSMEDPTPLLESASDFAYYPGTCYVFPFPFLFFLLISFLLWEILDDFHFDVLRVLFRFVGVQNDTAAKEFLGRFPLPLIIR